jgi:hypothetical protein
VCVRSMFGMLGMFMGFEDRIVGHGLFQKIEVNRIGRLLISNAASCLCQCPLCAKSDHRPHRPTSGV